MTILRKTTTGLATASMLLPSLAAAHPGHGSLPHGWDLILSLAALAILGAAAWRRSNRRR